MHSRAGMSLLCLSCPVCGADDVSTRVVTPVLAECKCRVCRHAWKVPVEPVPNPER